MKPVKKYFIPQVAIVFSMCVAMVLSVILFSGCSGNRADSSERFKAGLRALVAGDCEKSLLLFNRALEDNPDVANIPQIYNFIGVAHWKLGNTDEAVEAFLISREADSAYAAPLYNLGYISFINGRFDEAIARLNEVTILRPDDAVSRELLARIYETNNRFDEAERVLLEALKYNPDSASVLTSLGVIAQHKGNIDSALHFMLRASEKNSSYPPANYHLGMLYMRQKKDYVNSLKFFERYIVAEPEDEQRVRTTKNIIQSLKRVVDTGNR
ncbi:MAG: tetratricopeptide repeat protein [Lentisphaerae bacterium]|nr:tetratricopeptide repeat protein [Lentisphaerota bacterium]